MCKLVDLQQNDHVYVGIVIINQAEHRKKAQCTLKKLAVHFKIVIISQTAVKKPSISLIYYKVILSISEDFFSKNYPSGRAL